VSPAECSPQTAIKSSPVRHDRPGLGDGTRSSSYSLGVRLQRLAVQEDAPVDEIHRQVRR